MKNFKDRNPEKYNEFMKNEKKWLKNLKEKNPELYKKIIEKRAEKNDDKRLKQNKPDGK